MLFGRSYLFGAVIGSILTASSPATLAAQSLKSIRAQEAEEQTLDSEIEFTNSVCGTSISATINWRSASDWPEEDSLADACDDALGALEAICRAPGGQSKASSISSFLCEGDGSGPSLSGGTLSYGASPGESGFADTKDYLEGAL